MLGNTPSRRSFEAGTAGWPSLAYIIVSQGDTVHRRSRSTLTSAYSDDASRMVKRDNYVEGDCTILVFGLQEDPLRGRPATDAMPVGRSIR